MRTTAFIFLLTGLLALLMVGAAVGLAAMPSGDDQNAQGDRVVAEFYAAIKKRDFSGALEQCSPSFFERSSKEDVERFLKDRSDRLGTLISYELRERRRLVAQVGLPDVASLQVITLRVRYDRRDAQETIMIAKMHGDSALKVISYNAD